MSDLVACPTCQSTLRLPPNVATVRCPKCKSLLEVEVVPDAAAPPPPTALPPKPPPFAPANAAAKGAAVAKPSAAPMHRPELVDEAEEAERERARQAEAEAERKAKIRDELDEMERAKEEEEEKFEEVAEECRWGRSSLKTLRWSLLGYIASLVFGYLILLPLVGIGWIFGERALLAEVGVVVPGFSLLLTVGVVLGHGVGFGLAVRGPREARHIAVIGLVMVALQLVCACGSAAYAVVAVGEFAQPKTAVTGYPSMEIAYVMLGTATNLQTTTDAPIRLAFSLTTVGGYEVPWLNAVCGVFEFSRLLLLCQLVQRYGELAKADRIAAESPKTVNRVFFTLLVFALFRGAACAGFDWFQDRDAMWFIGQVIHLLIFEVAFLVILIRLLTQFQAIGETEDVLIPDRVASVYDTFNEV